MRNLLTLALVLFTGSLIGCGGQMTKEDMTQAWAATNAALAGGQSMASTALTNQDASLTFDYPCQGGGSASFSGLYDLDYDLSGNYNGTFEFDVGFAECSYTGIVIDGDISYDGVYNYGNNAYSYDLTYQGSLAFSGDVVGSCDIDMTYSYLIDYSVGLNYDVSYSGSICGYDAAADLSGGYTY